MPKDISAGRAWSRPSSWLSTRASALESAPPPYSFGQVGAVQPLAAMRSSHSFCSGFLNFALRPPQIELSSSSVIAPWAPRIDGGQFASSQARVSLRNVSRSLIILTNPGTYLRAARRAATVAVPFGSATPSIPALLRLGAITGPRRKSTMTQRQLRAAGVSREAAPA